ncbi:MAG: hypothetical protein ACE5FK_03570 [Candidatus Methylomirabilia bacterium]
MEDTTTLSHEHVVTGQLRDLSGKASTAKRGFFVHLVLMLDADSERTVGLIEQSRWCRSSEAVRIRSARGQPEVGS